MQSTCSRLAAASLLSLFLVACDGGGGSSPTGALGTGKRFVIQPGPNATAEMVSAMVTVVPGDVIEFGCGFFDITTTLQLANTEAITIKGCGMDQTVLSFRGPDDENRINIGILALNVAGLVVEDLTVADTDGNGFELRGVRHGTLRRVRAFWSSDGGNQSPDPITAQNFTDGRLAVACTDTARLNPNIPENEGGDTTSVDYTVSDSAGRYGIYPVSSDNILIDGTESIGASDAGIYVGQTNNAIIRNSRAAFNVFGFEIENVQGGEYHDNLAECNTGGFLIYDLDGNLRQYGDRTRMYRNIARNNNTYNFTEGGFVANVPRGSGMITLAYDRIDVFDNLFENNDTGGIIHASYELFPEGFGRPSEKRIDWYTEGMHVWNNTFINNGNFLPEASSEDMQNTDLARALPAILGRKTQSACGQPDNAQMCNERVPPEGSSAGDGYRGAHIIWDGLFDELDGECEYPTRPDGTDVPADERGKPQHTNQENPDCHYNAYKFNEAGERNAPDWWFSCIEANNTYAMDSLTYTNFHGLKGVDGAIAVALFAESGGSTPPPTPQQIQDSEQFPADLDMSLHDCPTAWGSQLARLEPVVIPPFVPSNNRDAKPTPAQIEALCNSAVDDGQVNFKAAPVNCPTLDKYNLFSDPEDPRSAPNSSDPDPDPGNSRDADVPGVPFVLNSKLFSDYAVKYRVLFMPTGTKAIYKDAEQGGDNETLIFPVGTIIAKTFAFADETNGTEDVVETRLLIKRVNNKTRIARWDGVAYIWETDSSGKRVARLAPEGGTKQVSWDFTDVDSGAPHSGTTNYEIPNANQCLSCHGREDGEPGAAPIGPKARNLNRPYLSESPIETGQSEHAIKGKNQIAWLCDNGSKQLMLGCPEDLTVDDDTQIANVERLPKFNVPGDSGAEADSDEDIEARARAYLEVNCMHCHNVRGFAASTGLYLEASGLPGLAYGMCKAPTAAGADGTGGRNHDIYPARSDLSIMEYRLSPAATSPSARMPPIARSVVDVEGHALIEQWIDDVIKVDPAKYPNSDACN